MANHARREPVTIEKHGRPVVVVLSTEEYGELEAIKLSRLRSEADEGLDALRRKGFIEPTGYLCTCDISPKCIFSTNDEKPRHGEKRRGSRLQGSSRRARCRARASARFGRA
ncbi:MAG: type II toxin-antitoxin system Phd/YefM family antitoxin [Gammaproteobacteria bacterium]|nr:type II toxin-antitoxin system Phd/YefM family antitoxin [Gammaproteobacteria bacterium]